MAIGEWAQEAPQEVLERLGALDRAIGSWLEDEVSPGRIESEHLAVAVDGTSVRGARQADGRALHRFAAMGHRKGVVVAQREVDHQANEITAFRPLLEPLALQGVVVTADAMHAQEEKGADSLFTVKDNQRGLKETLAALDAGAFPP